MEEEKSVKEVGSWQLAEFVWRIRGMGFCAGDKEDNLKFFYLVPASSWNRFNGESSWKWIKRIMTGNQQPSGGVQVIYQHCDILNKNGIKAYPVNLGAGWSSYRPYWFSHNTNPVSLKTAKQMIQVKDVIICPEVTPEAIAIFPAQKKVLFVQNWALVKKELLQIFSHILTVSPFCAEFMEKRSALPLSTVTNGIDHTLFNENGRKRKTNSVLFWGRKNRTDGTEAISMLPPEIKKDAEFVEAPNGLTQIEVVRLYRQSDIFLALGYPEGFALPPLEAMACGCAVVGFSGGGGNVHMIHDHTAMVAKDGDTKELSASLAEILSNKSLKEKVRSNGIQMSKSFTFQRMEEELLNFAEKQMRGRDEIKN